MNPYFTTNPNDIDEERQPNSFDVDDKSNVYFLQQAYQYHETLVEDENRPVLTRNPIYRDREGAEDHLMGDYFNEPCKYPLYYFRRRYRMSRRLFLKIVEGISTYEAGPLLKHFKFFKIQADCTGRMSLSVIMKCTAAIRQLAYGTTPDAFDEYLKMSERTAHDWLLYVNMCIIDLYMSKYLRNPTLEDVEKTYNQHLMRHGFPGILGSIDCMHWEWKQCLVSWQGQYDRGDKKYPTIMLEAVASQDLWIWHAFFGVAGANNDINVLDNSPLFDDLLEDKALVAPFVVNGVGFEKGYYLADEIYPQWATFVKSFTVANDAKHSYFKKRQESARKDVERAFAVLQGRWGIIQQPARQYHVNNIRRIMYSCIIMHNMILEDQKMAVTDWNKMYANPSRNMQRTWVERCETRKAKELRDRETHISLQPNLMEHVWNEVEHEYEDF
ncbi:ALP1-like protein [Tanacetum coccineum]|uniref:ALP1-like protein n=1 Tax=Tanacetum coccineum TaxID=301880 RepID=A0ABQ4Z0I2_9ASTR